jgi:hypothetical protein
MTSEALEAKLSLLDPNFRFDPVPGKFTHKRLCYLKGGEKEIVCLYEVGLMPEHSIMKVMEKEVWDQTVSHLNRADMPKGEYIPGRGWVFDPTVTRPGYKRVKVPWGEERRGWRTVLLKCIVSGILTPTAVESVFSTDDRAEWAGHLGRHPITRPW